MNRLGGLMAVAVVALMTSFIPTATNAQSEGSQEGRPLHAKHSGKCLDVRGASTEDAAKVVQNTCADGAQSQLLKREEVAGAGDSDSRFRFLHSDKCLDVRAAHTTNSAEVIQYTCTDGAKNQQWEDIYVPRQGGSLLRAHHSGKCLDVRGVSTEDDAEVVQYTCDESALNQIWR